MNHTFIGYPRENGTVGIRNHVFILPVQRYMNVLTNKICECVPGTQTITFTGEVGRPKSDRQLISRTLIGLALNPNTAGVMLIGSRKNHGYEEMKLEYMQDIIAGSGKRTAVLYMEEEGGFYKTLGEGIKMARGMVLEASRIRRQPFGLDKLSIAVKCGLSDSTSGIAGNPVVGRLFDTIVEAGGTACFSETTEVIGAEHLLAKKAANEAVALKIVGAVKATEAAALTTGEDIRKTNPIPENIAGGISTLEEKSLGAIVKAGSQTIVDVLQYGERPSGKGLYFIDAWMSSICLPLGYAAFGAQLMIFQMGGAGLPGKYPIMPGHNSGLVMPIMYMTGNREAYAKAEDGIDFCSGDVLTGKLSIDSAAHQLLEMILDIASGRMTKVETLRVQDPVEMYVKGPVF